GFETLCLGRGDLLGRDADNVGAAVIERVDFALIDIETGHWKFLFAKEQRQRQSNITEANDADFRLARLNARFQIRKKRRSSGLSSHDNNLSIGGRVHSRKSPLPL